jgi:hypothetical protein
MQRIYAFFLTLIAVAVVGQVLFVVLMPVVPFFILGLVIGGVLRSVYYRKRYW